MSSNFGLRAYFSDGLNVEVPPKQAYSNWGMLQAGTSCGLIEPMANPSLKLAELGFCFFVERNFLRNFFRSNLYP